MTRGTLFWVLMILWLLFGAYLFWPHGGEPRAFFALGNQFLTWVLFALLGWKVYGPALKE